MAATVDIIAGGRLEFGIGAGGSAVSDPAGLEMVHREYDAYGIDVVSPGEAVGALGEACTLIKRLWCDAEPFDFQGRHYQLKGAICEPKPLKRPGPPVLIGASGERVALGVVAQHADIWNCPTRGDVAEFRRKNAVLDEHCARIGRDPSTIARSVQVLVTGSDGGAGAPSQRQGLPNILGPVGARQLLMDFIDAGATHLVLAPAPPIPSEHPAQWLAEEVVEPEIAATA